MSEPFVCFVVRKGFVDRSRRACPGHRQSTRSRLRKRRRRTILSFRSSRPHG